MKPKDVAALMLEKKAENIKIFDVIKITAMTDYFIICTTTSDPQARAITNHIERTLRSSGLRPISVEGRDKLEWILMDYISFVVHIFNKEKRDFYDIDRLWADAKITKIKEKNEK